MNKKQSRFDDTTDSDTTRHEGSGEQTDESATRVGNRRQFLLGVGAATALLAGCVSGDDGGDESDSGDGDSSTGNGGDDSTDNGGDDSSTGNGGDDSSTGNGGDDSSTGNGGDDSTGNGDDSSTGNGGDDSTGNGGDDGTDNGGDDSTGNGGDGTASEVFFDTVKWSPEFRAVFTNEESGATVEYRVNDGEQYFSIEGGEGGSSEFYLLEDAVYSITEGQCLVFDNLPTQLPDDPREFEDIDDLETQQPEITEIGTDTIDGDPVTVYEVDAETVYTMYILESGFPRRVETPQGDSNYYDWGDTEPIEPPDMDCTSPGGGGDGGYGGDDGGDYP